MNICTCTRSKVLTPRCRHLDAILIGTTHAVRRPSASHSQFNTHGYALSPPPRRPTARGGEQREDKWLSRFFACNFQVPLLCKPLARAELSRSASPSAASGCSVLPALPKPHRLSPPHSTLTTLLSPLRPPSRARASSDSGSGERQQANGPFNTNKPPRQPVSTVRGTTRRAKDLHNNLRCHRGTPPHQG